MSKTNNKANNKIKNYLNKMVVAKAVNQHVQSCDKWNEGDVVEYWYDDDSLNVRFASGRVWQYNEIEQGVRGMKKTLKSD